jgi:uncharacterized protein (TIGR02996 family)
MPIHPDAKAFLTRLLADPSDTVLRLLLADWLAERGGTGSGNWAAYIRLRTEAASVFGTARELLREEAANVAEAVTAKLVLPVKTLVPHFLSLLDLLPPKQFRFTAVGYSPLPEGARMLTSAQAHRYRSLVVCEHRGEFAVLTDLIDDHESRVLTPFLQGQCITFFAETPEFERMLALTYPPLQEVESLTVPQDESAESPPASISTVCHDLLTAARQKKIRALEIVAMPSSYVVRWITEGRTSQHSTLTPEVGAEVVIWLTANAVDMGLALRLFPRASSFGDGVHLDLPTAADAPT